MLKIKKYKKITSMTALILVVFLFVSPINTVAYEKESMGDALELRQQLQLDNIERDLSSVSKIDKKSLSEGQRKLGTDLLRLTIGSPEVTSSERVRIEENLKGQKSFIELEDISLKGLNSATDDLVYVYIYLHEGMDTKIIDEYVNTVTDRDEKNNIAVAWVEVASIEKLSDVEGVRSIRTVLPPVVRSGSVNSQGDSLLFADAFRSANGIDGSGIKVGIISDGVDSIASAKASGDLPSKVTVLSNARGGDEGTAMLEIVHDLAPGAELYFHDSGTNRVAFNNAITALADAGCKIICDDIGWLAEPYFEDGDVAKHIDALIKDRNIVYVSSAGNNADEHYQALYRDSIVNIGGQNYHYHDADASLSGQQSVDIYIPAGRTITVIAQWNDAFGYSTNDYDLELWVYNPLTGYLELEAYSADNQLVTREPIEGFNYKNETSSDQYAVVDIVKYSGVAKTLEIYTFGAPVYEEYGVTADSIFGHPAVPDVIAVGAINASSTNVIAPYSSRGPVTISYPSSTTRAKPDLCAIDGVRVTGAGGFPSTFYGTSASAPHVAAVAALIWSQMPSKTAPQIRAMLRGGTTDKGSAGFDYTYGYGLLNTLIAGIPASPKSFSVTTGDKTATLSWSANIEPDLMDYRISYKLSTDSTWSTPIYVSKTSTSYTVTGLINGRQYNFSILARDKDGNWSLSNPTVTKSLEPKIITMAGIVINKDSQLVYMDVNYYLNVRSAGLFVYNASGNPIPPSYVKSSEGDYYTVLDFINARSATAEGTNEKAFDLLLDYPGLKQNITPHTVTYEGGEFIIH